MLSKFQKNIFLITAPSGAGKTSLIKNILKYANMREKKIFLSISDTTRVPRQGELNNIDYCFIDKLKFKENIKDGKYIEHAEVHGNFYGTPKANIEQHLEDGYKVILEIDWQGALTILKYYPDAQSIFISPPSLEDLSKRLTKRGLDSKEVILKRIKGAELELKQKDHFKFQIVNNLLDTATENLINIIFKGNNG